MSLPPYYINIHEAVTCSMTDAKATETFFIPWADRVDYITNVVGGPVDDGEGTINLQPGQQHPDYPILYVQQVECEPFGDFDAFNLTWESAKITLTYALNPYPDNSLLVNTTSKQHLDVTYETSIDGIILDKGQYTVNGVPISNNAVSPVHFTPLGKLTIRMPFEPAIDPTLWQSYCGYVNSDPFMGWDVDQVLFTTASTTRQISILAGADTWTYNMEFVVRAENGADWNSLYLPNASGGGYSWQAVQDQDGNSIYQEADFNEMINGFPV